MKILVLGYTQAGKSTAAALLAEILECKSITSSDIIIRDYAKACGEPEKLIRKSKDKYRETLYLFGNVLEEKNPAYPVDAMLQQTDVVAGIRNPSQLAAVSGKINLIVWIAKPGARPNSTDKLSPMNADVIIVNDGTVDDLRHELTNLLERCNVLRACEVF